MMVWYLHVSTGKHKEVQQMLRSAGAKSWVPKKQEDAANKLKLMSKGGVAALSAIVRAKKKLTEGLMLNRVRKV